MECPNTPYMRLINQRFYSFSPDQCSELSFEWDYERKTFTRCEIYVSPQNNSRACYFSIYEFVESFNEIMNSTTLSNQRKYQEWNSIIEHYKTYFIFHIQNPPSEDHTKYDTKAFNSAIRQLDSVAAKIHSAILQIQYENERKKRHEQYLNSYR